MAREAFILQNHRNCKVQGDFARDKGKELLDTEMAAKLLLLWVVVLVLFETEAFTYRREFYDPDSPFMSKYNIF